MARRVASVRDIDEGPRYAAGQLMLRNAPARTCVMTAPQKYRTSPLPAAIPGGFARSPASSPTAPATFTASSSRCGYKPETGPSSLMTVIVATPMGAQNYPLGTATRAEPQRLIAAHNEADPERSLTSMPITGGDTDDDLGIPGGRPSPVQACPVCTVICPMAAVVHGGFDQGLVCLPVAVTGWVLAVVTVWLPDTGVPAP